MYNVTLIPGDGIGPSVIDVAVKVLEATGIQFSWDKQLAGMAAVYEHGTPIPDSVLESIHKNKLVLKGPLTTPVGGGYRSVNVALRQEFQLYANLRPAVSFEGTKSPFSNIDITLIRENTEGLYAGIEHDIVVDNEKIAAESIALITRKGSERICRFAFEYAKTHKRKKVTAVHKANIMKCTAGMFLQIAQDVAKDYPDIIFEDKIIDACAMQLVMSPQNYDVIVTTNLFGDILSDLTSGLIGGLGLTAGANIGKEVALFEAVHGSAPDIAGQNLANPIAVIKAGVMLLQHVGEFKAAKAIDTTIHEMVAEGKYVTPDINPKTKCGTREMGSELIARVKKAVAK
ncbi:isocitrate/isopropylmalate dehydrogenase family protein [candidate division KSB1 bacterium]|nr:isocitrate/isopropylmalate dehydrogenase family protein [candidate division KSB1 bacterium]